MPDDPSDVLARFEVHELVHRVAVLGDRGRVEEMAALFTDDGVLEVAGRDLVEGPDAIARYLRDAGTRFAAAVERHGRLHHHVSSVAVELVGPGEAWAASYFLVMAASGPDHWGRYRDELVRVDGAWRLRRRRVHVDGASPGSVAAGG